MELAFPSETEALVGPLLKNGPGYPLSMKCGENVR